MCKYIWAKLQDWFEWFFIQQWHRFLAKWAKQCAALQYISCKKMSYWYLEVKVLSFRVIQNSNGSRVFSNKKWRLQFGYEFVIIISSDVTMYVHRCSDISESEFSVVLSPCCMLRHKQRVG